jgi:Animal haem peroxidase
MPSNSSKLKRVSGGGGHGDLRGADAPRSRQFEGNFGRMFRALPAAIFDEDELKNLANPGMGMLSPPETATNADGTDRRDENGFLVPSATPENAVDDEENFGIPAGYTYLGQFIDHDITFDPASSLQSLNDPDALVDFRTPALDLDNVYGRGPADQPYMFEADGIHFAFGKGLTRNGKPSKAQDLLRTSGTSRALIGDKRNDENVIVSQLHGVFLRFHNVVADELMKRSPNARFEDIQRLVRWHYQWVVLHDFLPRIVGLNVVHDVLPHLKSGTSIYKDKPNLHFFKWRHDPFMPVEFSVAAYRFGHSMVRPIYRLNTELGTGASQDEIKRGVAGRQFVFAAVQKQGLNGFHEFPTEWAIDWNLFFERKGTLDDPGNRGPNRVQPAYKIDSSLVNPLAFLPEFSQEKVPGPGLVQDKDGHPVAQLNGIANLAHRNLLRGMNMGLPSGQTVARYMGLDPIPDGELAVGKANVAGLTSNKRITDFGDSFKENAPLWFYVLAEAQHDWAQAAKKKPGKDDAKNMIPVRLGAVGGRIVAEVLIGLMLGDAHSYLSQSPMWKPWFTEKEQFGMPQFITAAGL